MEAMNNNQHTKAQTEWMRRTLPLEWTAEINLPDYRSEISRLLWVRPTYSVPTRFVGNGRVDFSGTVRYDVLYVGPDGRLYGTSEEVPYDFSVPVDEVAGGGEEPVLWAELFPDTVVSRVAAPRRLSLRCRLRVRVYGYLSTDLSPQCSGGNGAEPLQLYGVASASRVFAGVGEAVELNDAIDPDGGEDLRVILCTAEVFLTEAMATEGAVRCKGEAICTLICQREEGENTTPYPVVRRVPFAETVPVAGVSSDCDAYATAVVESASATIEDNRIQLSLRLVPEARAWREEPVCYVRDLYLPGYATACHTVSERILHYAYCGNRNFSISGELSPEEIGLPAAAEIVIAAAEAELKSHAAEAGQTVLNGDVRCHFIYKNEREFGTGEAVVPFRVRLEGTLTELDCCAFVPMLRLGVVRDKLRVDGELQLSVSGGTYEEICRVATAELAPAVSIPRVGVELRYPKPSDTLWEMAKRSGVSPQALALANGISAESPGETESLAGVKYLILP